jgi:O-antigen/teichoic acid export membrane protein
LNAPSHSSALKSLVGQTAIYGLSTVAVRLLNYVLVPLHTIAFATNQADYGVISELYAWVTFLNVVFMYGMETAFFRFAQARQDFSISGQNQGVDYRVVFGTAFTSLLLTTALGVGLLMVGSVSIADFLALPGKSRYVIWFAAIIGLDTLANVPFAALRQQGKPFYYLVVKILNVAINVGLNFFFLLPLAIGDYDRFASLGFTYNPSVGVGYVFLANLAASAVTMLALLPLIFKLRMNFDLLLWKRMMAYGSPFILAGLAGMVNETLDRILLVRWLPGDTLANRAQVGVYSAAYKLSIFMTLAVQAFRLGAEPFFFKMAGQQDARQVYALVMRGFVLAGCLIFLAVSITLNPLSFILGSNYRAALGVVPILLMANLFLGIFYNLSVWYKLTDRTTSAIWLAVAGALITLAGNFWGIPIYGYWASAWTTLAAYAGMAVLSGLWSRKHYPVPYPILRLGALILGALLWFLLYQQVEMARIFQENPYLLWPLRVLVLMGFAGMAWFIDGRQLVRQIRSS